MDTWGAGGDGKEKEKGSKNKCPFCGRNNCHMLSGGRPCFEAVRASKLLAEDRKEKEGSNQKKGSDAKGGSNSDEE